MIIDAQVFIFNVTSGFLNNVFLRTINYFFCCISKNYSSLTKKTEIKPC